MKDHPYNRDTEGILLNCTTARPRVLLLRLSASLASRHGWILIALLPLMLLVSCYRCPDHRLFVGTNINPAHECLYLARSLGYQKTIQARLVELPSASGVLRAFRNRSIDCAAITLDEALLLAAQGQNPKIVLVMNLSHGGDVILAQPEFSTFHQLKGKRIGVESSAMGAYILSRALELGEVPLDEVIIVQLEANEHEAAFRNREIDAIVTSDPVRTHLIKDGALTLFDNALIPNEIIEVLVVREDALATYHQELEELIHSWFQAVDHLNKYPEAAATQMAARTGMSANDLLSAMETLSTPQRQENQQLLGLKDPQFLTILTQLSETMSQRGLLPVPVNAHSLLTDKFVRENKE
jgi:NitT/TauT family transport system substrate-binding protein